MNSVCALCQVELSKFPVIDNEKSFCCTGCHVVFNILASKKQLEGFEDTTIFKQALKAGLISNPNLLEKIKLQKSETPSLELEKLHLEILEMWCPSCAEVIRLILLQQKGIFNCIVDYATDLASIEFSPRIISQEKIRELITILGYRALSLDSPERKKISLDLYIRFGIAAFCSLNAMMFSYPLYATYFDPQAHEDGKIFAWLTFLSSLPVVSYCMWPILRRFWSSLKVGLLGMEALVIIGVFSAFGLSIYELMHDSNHVFFDSMSVIITFVLLGKIIEAKAKFSAKESLFRLTKSLPRRARKRFPNGSVIHVAVKEIVEGDILEAYAGENIIFDGEVIEGEGTCDESLMTGESIPVIKKVGSQVLGGSILQYGKLSFKINGNSEQSTLQRIIQSVEQDLTHKSTYIRAVDPLIYWFVPFICVLAFGTWAFGQFFYPDTAIIRAISILLIACPCAIGIAAPLAESQILNKLASIGVIVRNRGCLSILPALSTFVFDKTGTITKGCFNVLEGLENLSKNEKGLLKTLCQPSNHPIARSIFESIKEDLTALDHVEECPGKGMRGFLENQMFLLGSRQFLKEYGFLVNEKENEISNFATCVYFASSEFKISRLSLGDSVREEVPTLLKKLKVQTILLSGDGEQTVKNVSAFCGFDAHFSQVNPLQKRDFIENLRQRGQVVCMVGDGINDAPALTAAQVGISVVSASDISIQVSDILLTSSHLQVLPEMLKIASKGQKILKQNLFWAFFYNGIGFGLAMAGLLSPIFAAVAMTLSSLIVLFNSKRIK